MPLDDNTPPVISAGPDIQVLSATGEAMLAGSVLDDGRPLGGVLSRGGHGSRFLEGETHESLGIHPTPLSRCMAGDRAPG